MGTRQQLYSFMPGLRELDQNISYIMTLDNINNVKDEYSSALSNSASFDELFNERPGLVFNYVNCLENKFMAAKIPDRNSIIASFVLQKISILETAYSNLTQSSTQSV